MKKYLLLFMLTMFSIVAFSQDKIVLNEGGDYKVKIVKKTDEALFVYFSDDTSKFVRKIPLFIVKSYEYKSLNDPKYSKEDSVLYLKYQKMIETNIKSQNTVTENITPVQVTYDKTAPVYDSDGNMLPSTPRDYFLKSKNQLIGSVVVGLIGGVAVSLISANAKNTNDLVMLGLVSGATAGISAGLSISSTINLYKGLLMLK